MRAIKLIVNWTFYIFVLFMLPIFIIFAAIFLLFAGLLDILSLVASKFRYFANKRDKSLDGKRKYLGDKFFWED